MSLANTNVELPDSMGEVCDIRATYDDHTQTAQQVMVNIRVDKDAIVCVSVFDSLDELLHKRLEAGVVQSRSWNRFHKGELNNYVLEPPTQGCFRIFYQKNFFSDQTLFETPTPVDYDTFSSFKRRILSSYAKPILVQLKLPMDGITSPVLSAPRSSKVEFHLPHAQHALMPVMCFSARCV